MPNPKSVINPDLWTLFHGALMTALSQACGLIISLPAVDPEHFNFVDWKGAAHVGGAIVYVVAIGEAKYFKDWADAFKRPHKENDNENDTKN
jgi:hypothetical protein